jgi:ribose 5-phosphate isomerase
MRPADEGKRTAAEAAVARVENGMQLGLGIGSTMRYAPDALGRRVGEEGPRVTGMPISKQTAAQARGLGIPLGDCVTLEVLDLAIDGVMGWNAAPCARSRVWVVRSCGRRSWPRRASASSWRRPL